MKTQLSAELLAETVEYRRNQLVKELERQARNAEDLAVLLHARAKDIQENNYVAGNMPISPYDRFNWAINDIENYIRNINFANLARAAAQYQQTQEL